MLLTLRTAVWLQGLTSCLLGDQGSCELTLRRTSCMNWLATYHSSLYLVWVRMRNSSWLIFCCNCSAHLWHPRWDYLYGSYVYSEVFQKFCSIVMEHCTFCACFCDSVMELEQSEELFGICILSKCIKLVFICFWISCQGCQYCRVHVEMAIVIPTQSLCRCCWSPFMSCGESYPCVYSTILILEISNRLLECLRQANRTFTTPSFVSSE